MSRRDLLAAILCVLVIGTMRTAAQPATFAGNWSAQPPAPPEKGAAPRGDMGSGWGTPLTITQTGAELVVSHAFFSRYDLQPPLRYVYKLDGSESRNSTMAGHATQTRVSRATWDGAALKIVTTYPGIDPSTGKPFTTTVTQRLSLTAPDELVIETLRAGALGGRDTTTRTVYKKTP